MKDLEKTLYLDSFGHPLLELLNSLYRKLAHQSRGLQRVKR